MWRTGMIPTLSISRTLTVSASREVRRRAPNVALSKVLPAWSNKRRLLLTQRLTRRLVGRIGEQYKRHPLLANSLTLAVLYAGAELSQQTICQWLRRRRTATAGESSLSLVSTPHLHYDLGAVKRYVLFGGLVHAPLFRSWYRWLDGRFSGTAVNVVAKKVALDQFVLSPPSLALFFGKTSHHDGAFRT